MLALEHQVAPEVAFLEMVNSGDLMRVQRALRDFPRSSTTKARDPKSGSTALLTAAMKGHLAIVTELLKFGADASAKNSYGLTPLHVACKQGHASIVQSLVGAGASVSALDKMGKSPSDYASALPESAKQRRTQIENTLLFGSLAGGGSIGAGGSGGGCGGDGGDLFDDDGFSASQEDEEEEDDVFGALGGAGEPVDAVAAELLKRRISMENHSLFAALLGPDASPLKDAGAVAVSPPPAAADIVRPRASSETCWRWATP